MSGLEQFFGHRGSIIGQQLGLQAFNQQQDLGAMQGAGELQKLFQAEQMNPLKLQQQSLQNQTEQAQLPGVQAQSELLGQTARVGRETLDNKIQSTNSRFMQDMDDDQLKLMHNMAQRMAYDANPEVRKAGVEMMEQHADVLKEKSKQKFMAERSMELERLRGANQMNAAREVTNRIGIKAEAGSDKPMNMSQLEAWARRRIAEDPTDMVAAGILMGKQTDAVEKATAGTVARDELTRELIKRPDQTPQAPVSPNRYAAPGAAAPAPKQQMFAKNPKTGERIISTDGGKTWQKAQ